jgi:regulator of nucleoside diphosphate kinase
MTKLNDIVMTGHDYARLRRLVDQRRMTDAVDALDSELERATVVGPHEIPADTVTMNSSIDLEDLDTGERQVISIVFPGAAAPKRGRVSVLAPLGTALLGYREGEVIEWAMPGGSRRFRIKRVRYQPEAAGRFDL